MTALQRRVCLAVGAGLAVVFGLAIVTGLRSIDGDLSAVSTATAVTALLSLLGSGAFLLAGRHESIALGDRSIAWWQLAGGGLVLLGNGMAVPGIHRLPSAFGVVTLLGGIAVCCVGIVELRRGPPAPGDARLSNRDVTMIVGGGVLLIFTVLFVQLVFVPG